jgi:hypothetical protein
MDNFYARTVFFVSDGEASLAFYTQTLGFSLDMCFPVGSVRIRANPQSSF